jgi:serine/threonine-protein kinase
LTGDPKPLPFLQTPFQETGPSLSPDGRWLAYSSDESGRAEVYVRPFPEGAGKRQVSTEGAGRPVWSGSGELFYNEGNRYMAVTLETQPTLSVGTPRLLFEGSYAAIVQARNFDVSADGQRFVMLKPVEQEQAPPHIVVVQNWFEELRRRMPTRR